MRLRFVQDDGQSPADAVESNAQEQGDGQHGPSGVAPQLDVVVEHARPERRRAPKATTAALLLDADIDIIVGERDSSHR